MKLVRPITIWLPTWQGWLVLLPLLAGCIIAAVVNVHAFLAVTQRAAAAEIIVVEAWVPETVARAAAREYRDGNYASLVVTDVKRPEGMEPANTVRNYSFIKRMESYGVPRNRILLSLGAATDEYRSFAMARSLRNTLQERGIRAKGVNIVAPAAHARKTWLAYTRALGSSTSVGIVAVMTGDYDPDRWWRTSQGVKWVIANGAGWMHELLAGPRE